MKMKFSLILAGSLLVMASVASAANKAESFSISPVAGGITFEGKQHLKTTPLYGLRAGYNFTKEFGVEALFDYALTGFTSRDQKVDFFRYGAEALYHFMPDSGFVPYIAAGFGGTNFNKNTPLNTRTTARGVFDYGVGAKFFLTDNIALRGDVRHLLYSINDATQHAVEYVVGLYIPFGGAKAAAKPVVREVEPPPAPAPAPVAKPVVAPAPPPPPPAPTADLSVSPGKITKGESATLRWTSQNASRCDIQPGIGSVQPQGSMSITPDDNTAYNLTCNGEGGAATSAARIGVTVPPPVVVEAAQPKASAAKLCSPTVLNVHFDTNKYNIKPQYHEELQKLGDFLKEFPDAKGVIEGHTDSVGSKASNMKLSQNRAESVRSYIIKKFGIAPERIGAKGYGPTKPVADNKTKEGKQQNRRIEANFTCNN